MSKHIDFLDYLPVLPANLLNDVHWSIRNCKNIFVDPNHKSYQQFLVNSKVKAFIATIFEFRHLVTIQVIKTGLPIHIDMGRVEAYNYIIDTGGINATTVFYKSSDFYYDVGKKLRAKSDSYEILEQFVLPENRWHKINVSVPHNVINIDSDRISISVNLL